MRTWLIQFLQEMCQLYGTSASWGTRLRPSCTSDWARKWWLQCEAMRFICSWASPTANAKNCCFFVLAYGDRHGGPAQLLCAIEVLRFSEASMERFMQPSIGFGFGKIPWRFYFLCFSLSFFFYLFFKIHVYFFTTHWTVDACWKNFKYTMNIYLRFQIHIEHFL